MGVVFRALDTKLHRALALKLLPDHFADDPDRLFRFQREAQVLASLNHPNIAQIYGLEESNDARCIVMELVEGETLQERLKRGAIPVAEGLRIAKQIAEALEAAHERDIIHSDLKPGNIKLTSEGTVKVLDFGFVKALREGQGPDVSNSPTLVGSASMAGVILGTATYMSPEQAKGRPVDKRTDILAFGCVLYEMLTARQAFEGEDVQDILSRVLQSEPDWSRLPSGLSSRVEEVLRGCLEKDVKNRRRDMGDVRIDLQLAPKEPDGIALSAVPAARSRFPWVLVAVLGLLVALLSIPTALYLRERSSESPEMRVDIDTPATPQPLHFALSPDGMQLVFVGSGGNESQQLWLRPLNAATAQPLAGTEGAEYPFWSPDSRSVGFFAGSKLKRLDIGAGPPQVIADAGAGRGGTWSREGTILFAPTTASPLWRVPASGGSAPVQVTKLDLPRQGSQRFPQFLPDGVTFCFLVRAVLTRRESIWHHSRVAMPSA
jgi:serine/threonine protein kinase